MQIILSNIAGVPIYEQIKEQIKTAIVSEVLSEGELLPSIRQLARDLRISVITTTRAYSELEKEGYIATVQGKGSYVLPQNIELIRERKLRDIEENLLMAIGAAKMIRLADADIKQMLDLLLEEPK